MSTKVVVFFAVIATAFLAESKTVIVGEMFGPNSATRLIFQKQVEVSAIPFMKRVEEVFYEYPNQGLLIKGIAIRDLKNSNAEPSITRGGIGFGFVNIKLKTERGSGMHYSIEIYG